MTEWLIIGGGVSGLAAARALSEKGISNVLVEATDRVGGVIDTVYTESAFQLNYGANTLFVTDAVEDFLRRAGLGPNWVEPMPRLAKNRYVLKGEEYAKMPGGPLSLLLGDYFSLKTRLRFLRELRYRGRGLEHESVYSFFERHFGAEVCEMAVQPFLAGIYAADARELLMELVFPNLLKLKAEYGSIAKAALKGKLATGRRKSISYVMGMRELCEALAEMSDKVQGSQPIERLEREGEAWVAVSRSGQRFEARRLALALPAYEAARLLAPHLPAVAQGLEVVRYTALAQVHLGFPEGSVHRQPEGFGGLHPPSAGRFTSGVLNIGDILPMRQPAGQKLYVAFVGGEGRTDIRALTDEQILAGAEADLRLLYGVDAEAAPTLRHLRRWDKALPIYDKHLLSIPALAAEAEAAGVTLLGNYLGGVSVQNRLEAGMRLAGIPTG